MNLQPNRSRERTVVLFVAALTIGSVAFGGAVLGAASNQADTRETTSVRAFHGAPDAPNVDVYVDERAIATNLSFGQASDYRSLDVATNASQNHSLVVTAAGNRSAVVLERNVTLEPNSSSTIVVSGEISEGAETSLEPLVLTDNATEPAEGTAAVRMAHLSPDAGTVDVTVQETGDVLFENVSFRDASGYVTVPAGNYTLEVRENTAANDGAVVRVVNVSLESGTAYSAFAVGYLSVPASPGDEILDVVLTTDATVPAATPSPTATETATATATSTGTPTVTETATATETPTLTAIGTETPPGTITPTPTPITTGTPTVVA